MSQKDLFLLQTFQLMVILITGSSRGIGAALATSFTKAGQRVLLVSRNRKSLQQVAEQCNREAGKVLAHPLPFDLMDLPDLESEFISLLGEHTSTIDALVNNAGQLIRKPFHEVPLQDARKLFEVNFFVPAQLIRICRPFMKDSALKHVVNVTSMAGFQGSKKFSGLSYYSASKAALGTLTESLSEEYMEEGIKVNALSIGSVQTEMLAEAFPGLKAPLRPGQMAEFMKWFTLEGSQYFNGKILPVSLDTP